MTNKFTIRFEFEDRVNGNSDGDEPRGYVYYSLSAYINYMITTDDNGNNADFIAAAKALYALSEAAEAYYNYK
jgi:hypothetical protein